MRLVRPAYAVLAVLGVTVAAAGCPSLAGFAGVDGGADATADTTGLCGDDASDDACGDEGDGGAASPFTVVQSLDGGETLTAVYAADPQHAFAVGTHGVRYQLVGSTWTRSQATSTRDFEGIWGSSKDDVYAVGVENGTMPRSGFVQRYQPQAGWGDDYLPPVPVHGIFGTGPVASEYILVVGDGGNAYDKQIGGEPWAMAFTMTLPPNPYVPSTPQSPILWSLSGWDYQHLIFAADVDTVYYFDAIAGAVDFLAPADDRTIAFRAVWQSPGTRPNAFFGMNYYGAGWLTDLAPDGGMIPADAGPPVAVYYLTKDKQPSNKDRFLRGVWGDARQVLFVGDEGRIYSFAMNAINAVPVTSPTGVALYGVSGSGSQDVWIVGANETILHGTLPP